MLSAFTPIIIRRTRIAIPWRNCGVNADTDAEADAEIDFTAECWWRTKDEYIWMNRMFE